MNFVLLIVGSLLVVSAVKHARAIAPSSSSTASSDPSSSRPRFDDHQGIAVGEPNPAAPKPDEFTMGVCSCFWAGGTCPCGGTK